MCGIAGIISFRELTGANEQQCSAAVQTLIKRGPDAQDTLRSGNICLAHSRLSIIDPSTSANQPFEDRSKKYALSFNGEIYNYKELRQKLSSQYGIPFETESDTEVLLYWLIKKGKEGLQDLNGFFAFAFLDKEKQELLLARDRYGIKPLIYKVEKDRLIFASEVRALEKFDFKKEVDMDSLYTYLQLSYVPSPHSMYEGVKKLEAGTSMKITSSGDILQHSYYNLPSPHLYQNPEKSTYEEAQKKVVELLTASVQRRMLADVPLGTFLSGGVDSSIITAIASQQKKNLSTFSIGYKEEPFFDETEYALAVAKKFGTDHHVFSLENKEIEKSIYELLEDVDEPFADSSAIAVNVLSKKTRELVTVALSGDGADELFSGYNKHMAEYLIRKRAKQLNSFRIAKYLLPILPQSRNSKIGNLGRKAKKFIESAQLSEKERYWFMASLMSESAADHLLTINSGGHTYQQRKESLITELHGKGFNEVLFTDFRMVLESDMLYKVDKMSMRNSLEVRIPFLDHHLVDYVFRLPAHYKIQGRVKKRILQDAFRDILPKEIYHRSKKGFEVPLLKLFRGSLSHLVEDNLLSNEFIARQNIFDPESVNKLKKQLKSNQPSNSQQIIWSLLLFNTWWIKNF